jgi:hypothetical protein
MNNLEADEALRAGEESLHLLACTFKNGLELQQGRAARKLGGETDSRSEASGQAG